MIKLLHPAAFPELTKIAARIMEDPALVKSASSNIFGKTYADMVPDKDHVGIHLTAMGAYERYGANRNGDGFPKQACLDRHKTFVTHGHVYEHHENKNPAKAMGSIKASAYNADMDRVELFIHAHKEKAAKWLTQIEKEGEAPVSMACHVPFDVCSICKQARRNSADPKMCDHLKHQLGQLMPNGKLAAMLNTEPTFFDISFVSRPADKIAYTLLKAAGVEEIPDSVKLAHEANITLPASLQGSDCTYAKTEILRKIAKWQDYFLGGAVGSDNDHYYGALAKAANADIAVPVIEQLRTYEPSEAFSKLAQAGCVLTPRQFLSYACGSPELRGIDVEKLASVIQDHLASVIETVAKSGDFNEIYKESAYDTDVAGGFLSERIPALVGASWLGAGRDTRVLEKVASGARVTFALAKQASACENTPEIRDLCVKYAQYLVSAVHAVTLAHGPDAQESICAIAAAQNVTR